MKSIKMRFYDKKGIEIEEFDLLKVFHFIGARRKKHYMYKWVRVVDGHLVGMHLMSDKPGNYFALRSIASDDDKLLNCEIIHSKNWRKLD